MVGIGCGTSIIAGDMPEETARELFQPRAVAGGAQAPNGRAMPVDGGYRVTGAVAVRERLHALLGLVGGTLVIEGDAPRMMPGGMPDCALAVFPLEDVEIIDTWHVSGLRGTGSRDLEVKDVFVPEERMIGCFRRQAVRRRADLSLPERWGSWR